MSDIEFPAGLFAKRNDSAPDYVLCKLSVRKREFIEYLQSMGGDDWANFEVKRSKAGKVYVALDTWEPSQQKVNEQGMAQTRQETGYEKDLADDDIPF